MSIYSDSEEMVIKAEPIDMFDHGESPYEEGEEPEPTWHPIKIESIINSNKQSEEESSEESEPVKPDPPTRSKRKTKEKGANPPTRKKTPKPVKKRRPKAKDLGDEFMCSKCSKRCVNLAGLSSHYMRCGNNEKPFTNIVKSNEGIHCIDCGKAFKDLRGAKIHRLYCNQARSGPNFVKQENEIYSLQKLEYECDICGLTFRVKARIKQHMMIEHSADSSFTCDVCGKRSIAKSIHEIHMRTHLDQRDRPFACMQCTKNFKSKAELQKHVYGVHVPADEKPSFACDECPFVTCKQEFLLKHQVNKHIPDSQKPFQCDTCTKGFMTDKEFDRHMKTHTQQKIHSCPGCKRTFKTNAEMKEHYVKDHTDDKPFICEVCNKGCNHRHTYRRHLRKHEKELGIKLDKSVRKFNIRLEDYLPQDSQ